MTVNIKNQDILARHGNKLLEFCQKRFAFNRMPNITFLTDKDEYHKLVGKTAYYDPQNENIVVYIHGRHPKDILRSLAHEIVHHDQNCRGELFSQETLGPGYAQTNCHMREMEREAYERGNLAFRDYEDILKQKFKGGSIMIESKLQSVIKKLIKQKLNEGSMPAAALAGLRKSQGKAASTDESHCVESEDEGVSKKEDCPKCSGKDPDADCKCDKTESLDEEVNEKFAIKKGSVCCGKDGCPGPNEAHPELKSEELEESKIITPEQEESFHNRLFGTRLVALNAKLMSNFIKK